MKARPLYSYLDAIYGECTLPAAVAALVRKPVMNRLRDVRQSNIDSLGQPGFANCSRFEHSLGTAFLATNVGFRANLDSFTRVTLVAACLLHDSAISPFGHLVEEAFAYLGKHLDHESRWQLLMNGENQQAVGGMHLQLFLGREAGIVEWAKSIPGSPDLLLQDILNAINGEGRLGPAVCGALDLDNIDNVVRAAYHAGVGVASNLPLELAKAMRDVSSTGIVFAEGATPLIKQWLTLRSKLYGELMFNEDDFVGKAMLLRATVSALELGILKDSDWRLTDREFIGRLLESEEPSVTGIVKSWLSGELRPLAGLFLLEGNPPSFASLYAFGEKISELLGRQCFAYRIKDKRYRRVTLTIEGIGECEVGEDSRFWLLGIISGGKQVFKRNDFEVIQRLAVNEFQASRIAWGDSAKRISGSAVKHELF